MWRGLAGCTFSLLFSINCVAFDVIAHRGASGYLPEHTLAAAALAHGQSPDYIEQDLVLSKDGVPVVLHDIHLETVTNVEQVFPQRARADGRWYAIDFTLKELRQLRIHERQTTEQRPVFPNRYGATAHFSIATFEDHIQTITELNRLTGKRVGLYPEIKSPAFHRQHGQDISAIVLGILNNYQLNTADANIIVQCFDFNEVKRLRTELGLATRLVQLVGENSWKESDTDYDWLITEQGLKTVRQYADGLGPWFPQVIETEPKNSMGHGKPWIEQAKQLGFTLHPYTFRADDLPAELTGEQLLDALKKAGADGVFTDQVPPVLTWRENTKTSK